MLACARIGAIHTAIFSGYAEGGVRSRIQGCKARVVITADAAVRAGKFKPLKANLDPILEKCPSVAHGYVGQKNMKHSAAAHWKTPTTFGAREHRS
jgi:Acyl-coenzyme A synthetases/AMP-(fatty) acid ligases